MTTSPALPARAVRPDRCRYALCSTGGSTCTTSSTSSTWTPRAAMSVATSTRRLAGRERGEVAVARRLRQVAVQVDRRDAGVGQLLGELLGLVLGAHEQDAAAGARGERVHELPSWRRRRSRGRRGGSSPRRASWPRRRSARPGCCRKRLTSLSTPLSSVAENSRRWPPAGVAARMRVTPGRKPRSAMWSASSITVISTASRRSARWLIRSSRRPGQATTMSTPAAQRLDLAVLRARRRRSW